MTGLADRDIAERIWGRPGVACPNHVAGWVPEALAKDLRKRHVGVIEDVPVVAIRCNRVPTPKPAKIEWPA